MILPLGATIQLYAGTELAFGDGKCAKDGIAMPCKAQLCASEAVIAPGFISLVNLSHGTGNALLDGVLLSYLILFIYLYIRIVLEYEDVF